MKYIFKLLLLEILLNIQLKPWINSRIKVKVICVIHHVDVAVSDYDVRLIGGSSRCSGRVEISYRGSWGGICSQQWDKSDAQVLCRQLGCGDPVSVFADFGRSSGPMYLSELLCRGDENKLTDCGHSGWENAPCDDFPHTGIVCNETQWVNTEFPLIPESDSDQIEASSAAIKVKPASPLSVTGTNLNLKVYF